MPWVLHVDLDQFLAAVEILRHPELAGLPADRRRARRPHRARRGVDGVLRGARVRGAVRDAAQGRRAQVPGGGAAARRLPRLRGGVGAGHGGAAGYAGCGRGGARLGRGVRGRDDRRPAWRTPSRSAPRSSAATDLHCSVGVGDTKVRAKIATDFGKPRGVFELTRDNWFEVMGDRPTIAIWGVGLEDLAAAGRPRLPDGAATWPTADEATLVAEFGPTMGPHYGRLGRGVSWAHGRRHPVGRPRPRPRDDLPDEPRRARRRSRTPSAPWPSRWSRTSGARSGPASGSSSRCGSRRSSPRTGSASWPSRRSTPTSSPPPRSTCCTALEDDRPIRLLGVRAEMVPPEGGYVDPRTTGRGGPSARAAGTGGATE